MIVFWTGEHVLSAADIPKIIEELEGLPGPGIATPDQATRITKLWEEIKEMLLRISKLEERLDRIERDFAGGTAREDGGLTEYGRNLGLEEKKP